MAIISSARKQRLGYSLFLYWKIFAHRSTASWHPKKCNMIGPFTTFEFSSQNVLDGNHDVLVIRRYKDVSVFNWWNFLQRKCGSARKSQPCKKTTKNGLWHAMERTPYLPQACEEACAPCNRTPLIDRIPCLHCSTCIILLIHTLTCRYHYHTVCAQYVLYSQTSQNRLLCYFTLSNAIQFYSSRKSLWVGKG